MGVVIIDRRNSRVFLFKFLAWVEYEYREVLNGVSTGSMARKSLTHTHLQNDELQFCDIIPVNPVFRGLADKVLLRTAGGRVTLDGIALVADQIVQL